MQPEGDNSDRKDADPIRAAEYLRMSTEHQRYSTENQAKIIHQYAEKHGFEIVRTYADEGKSGLTFKGRPEMQRMLADVEGGMADFKFILIYDVTRWGRYQDSDESTFYEYRFKQAGVKIIFCAEQFQNAEASGQISIVSFQRKWQVITAVFFPLKFILDKPI